MASAVQEETVAKLSPLITSAIDALLKHKMEKSPDALLPSSVGSRAPLTSQSARVSATKAGPETFPLPITGSQGLPEQHPLRFIAQYLMRHKNDAIPANS